MSTPNEPLAGFVCDLGKYDATRPVPIPGDYVVEVRNVEGVFAQSDQSKPMWKVTYATCYPAQAMAGSDGVSKELSPGYTITENILMYQPEQKPGKNPAPDFKQRVALCYDACHGTNNDTRPSNFGDLRSCVGKKAVITTVVRDSEFGVQVDVKKIKPAPAGA